MLPKVQARAAQASATSYPTCNGGSDDTGYAQFAQYNIQGSQIVSSTIPYRADDRLHLRYITGVRIFSSVRSNAMQLIVSELPA
jgi:hypothetical protein